METFESNGLILEAESINEQIQHGQKTTFDFVGETIAIVRDGQLKRIKPYNSNDKNTNEDGTWRVTVDEDGDFYANDSWFVMHSEGITRPNSKFTDGGSPRAGDTVHRVIGRVGEVDRAYEPTPENQIITVGDREFLIVDNKAYEIYK